MNNEELRLREWQELINEYSNFFYKDDGIFTCSLFDRELKQYKLDFDYIKKLIKKLKKYERKYVRLNDTEMEELQEYKRILLGLDTGTNGINNIYQKMSNMYYFIENY